MKKRVWELDVIRGIFLIAIVLFHLLYDLVFLFGILPLRRPGIWSFLNGWLGMPFVVISGISATLGSRPVKRGGQVFTCGMVITLATLGMYLVNFADKSIIIYFGVLHCLGTCMLLWPLFRKAPVWLLTLLGAALAAAGLYLREHCLVTFPWLMPLGFTFPGFASSDYFPLMPNLGWFLLGAAAGRLLFPEKESLLPMVDEKIFPLAPLGWLGRHSLLIYMLHQPVLAGAVAVLEKFL